MRNLLKFRTINDVLHSRSLRESAMLPELSAVLHDWSVSVKTGVVIGGLALGFHVRPRMTQDVDILFLSDSDIPDVVPGFKKTRGHAFQHNETHAEVEVLDPEFLRISKELVRRVFDTAIENDGLRVASESGLVALKLGRFSLQDRADISALIKTGRVDLTGWSLDDKMKARYEQSITESQTDSHPA